MCLYGVWAVEEVYTCGDDDDDDDGDEYVNDVAAEAEC